MVGSGISTPLTERIDANRLIYDFFDKHRFAAETSVVADQNQTQSLKRASGQSMCVTCLTSCARTARRMEHLAAENAGLFS